ncbi:MAG: hypothetical protein KDI73_08460 [Candidatus Competibacteraceae bacterium]|nr:hypothetical protein [Candidatus Competibacteraceae bacterium]
MRDITGLIGHDGVVEKAAQEVRKGRHVILTWQGGRGRQIQRLKGGSRAPGAASRSARPGRCRSR